jgi:hypothetical protein
MAQLAVQVRIVVRVLSEGARAATTKFTAAARDLILHSPGYGDSPSIRFLIPCTQNWASWDAALIIGRKEQKELHVVFLQLALDPEQKIFSKGLNHVRNALPANLGVDFMFIMNMFWFY